MKRFLIVVNPEKDTEYAVTHQIQDILASRGAESTVADVFGLTQIDETSAYDGILVLGGDGTLLRAASAAEDTDLPLVGINLGTVGFLTEGEVAKVEPLLEKLLRDEFAIEERMMITGTVCKSDGTTYKKRALNDIVISRSGFSRLIGLDVSVDGQVLDTYEADGVVVATPTGSTGYNLSAGGPIVSPDARLIVITPVSPHSLTAKSIVLSGNEKITIEITKKRKTQDTEAICSFDGGNDIGLSAGDRVDICRSGKTTRLVKASHMNFYEILRNKLGGK